MKNDHTRIDEGDPAIDDPSRKIRRPEPTGTPGSVGRVHLLTWRQSWRMTRSGLKNRLGRSIVTLLGIVLGIAFLMSTLVSSHLRARLSEVAQRRVRTQSMIGMLRAEIGNPDGKKVVMVSDDGADDAPTRASFVESLRALEGLDFVGPIASAEAAGRRDAFEGADAAVDWGHGGTDPTWHAHVALMAQPVVLYRRADDAAAPRLDDTVRVRDLLPPLTERQKEDRQREAAGGRARTRWLVAMSLLVAAIGISNALLMSVTERYREIGTMKCLGALNAFVIRLILLESSLLGGCGAVLGVLLGMAFALGGYLGTYGGAVVWPVLESGPLLRAALVCLGTGWVVSVLAAIYPARVAATMVPASALRSEV
ncbi:MAG: hypothetical protein CMJ18_24385 [Phycisphaeraceae bacterium]|nr:hypothetical protein [Phycisphaeraceae bacterium]